MIFGGGENSTGEMRNFHPALTRAGQPTFFQISAPGLDPLRFRLRVDTKRGASLKLKLTVAT